MDTHDHTTLPAVVTINKQTITPLEAHGMRVVTFDLVAQLHEVPLDTVRKSFTRNRERFTEGKHFYRAYTEEESGTLSPNKGLPAILLTEKGYLLLVKPMRDDTSWRVQEEMIDHYFALREQAAAPMDMDEIVAYQAQRLVEIRKHQEAIEKEQLRLAARVAAIEEALPDPAKQMSVKAFANMLGVSLNATQANRLGRRCAGLSRALGRQIGTLPDENWGQVNAYDRDILETIFKDEMPGDSIINTGAEA